MFAVRGHVTKHLLLDMNLIGVVTEDGITGVYYMNKKKPKEYKKADGGYSLKIEKDDDIYNIYLTDRELTDIEYSKQLIKNRINMAKVHKENLKTLMETEF